MLNNSARYWKIVHLSLVLGFLSACVSTGFEKPLSECSRDDAFQAEDVAVAIRSWDDAYQFYERYRQCVDGSIAEGMNDRVQLLWADHWDQLPRMLVLFKVDKHFKQFIWPIIQSEAFPMDTFEKVLLNAEQDCPRNASEFCEAIKQQSKRRYPRHDA